MKRSIFMAIVLSMFALPVNAHDTKMLKRELAFNAAVWIGKGKVKVDCVLKLDVLNKYSDEKLELLNLIFSTGMPKEIGRRLFPEAGVDKLTVAVNKNCKK